jgi:methylphosphotriester-DNA--protein-cysteine methyltransferase
MAYEYRMVQIPPTITVKASEHQGNEAAQYLQAVANEQAAQGWEFYRVDTVGVLSKPGCLASLLGGKAAVIEYFVVTFRKQK